MGRRPRRWATPLLVAVTLVLGAAHGRVAGAAAGLRTDDPAVVRAELAFLRDALGSGAGERMQELFPEGYFFSHALLGLAWCDLAATGRADPAVASSHARWALDRLESPAGTAPFAAGLEPAYGIFYAGWSLLLRAELAATARSDRPNWRRLPVAEGTQPAVGPSSGIDDRRRLERGGNEVAAAVAAALDAGGSPFLPAYPGQAWPVDTVVALAGLRAADAVTGADHTGLVERWVARADADADPLTGLLPHRVDPSTGEVLQASRGTSQSIIQRFWPSVDPAGAEASYRAFRQHFVTRELGIVGIREYPHGVTGRGDVDSGPLPLGVSVSATAVTIGAARANGDLRLATVLANEIDAFGAPVSWDGRRRYIGGALPVGDGFVAWARAAPAGAERGYPPVRPLWPAWLAVPWAVVAAVWWLRLRRLVPPRAAPGAVLAAGQPLLPGASPVPRDH